MASLEPQDLAYADEAPVRPEATVVVGGSPAEVWAVLADHRRWPEWFGSGMRKATPTSEQEDGVGSTRRVDLGLMKVDERFIAWDVGELWAFTGTDMNPKVFTKLVERVVLEPLDRGRTRVTYRMAFELVPPMRPLAGPLRSGMSRALRKGLAGLADRVERVEGVLTVAGGDATARRGDRGASMALLLLGLVIMGVMAVVVLKVVDRQDQDTATTLKDLHTAGGDLTASTPTSGPVSTAPGAPTTAPGNFRGSTQALVCDNEKQTVTAAEQAGSALEGRPLTIAELKSLGYLGEVPPDYDVVIRPDGTAAVQTKDPKICP